MPFCTVSFPSINLQFEQQDSLFLQRVCNSFRCSRLLMAFILTFIKMVFVRIQI
jgi:hypothetical protein